MQSAKDTTRELPEIEAPTVCFHCGQPCVDETFVVGKKPFCCFGCKTVYEILQENNLGDYYDFEANPGIRREEIQEDAFAYLDEKEIRSKILQFDLPNMARVQFNVPAIHCISCVWLLENLYRLNSGIIKTRVNFARKTVSIDFNPGKINLSETAKLLHITGYKPVVTWDDETRKEGNPDGGGLITKLAVAGFCFGNMMLLSFPEYLGIDSSDSSLQSLFSYLIIALSIPVLMYSGSDYFKAAISAIRQRQINIDVPIAVGLAVLFARSLHDIFLHVGGGYMDSLAGLVFFLLIGRWFQSKTYENLAFDRDYRSYFPLAVYKKHEGGWKAVLVHTLRRGDHIRIRNREIVPADSFLLGDHAYIDYSFVTGESRPTEVNAGDIIYAGGRLLGKPVVMTVSKESEQSHLSSLWNNEIFEKANSRSYQTIMDRVAKVFTWGVMTLALGTGLYWYVVDASQVGIIVTSVLMVACPCALALAAPFTYGNALRAMGLHGLYLKNAEVVEKMATINSIVFDKTGTITHGTASIQWIGDMSQQELQMVKVLAEASTHPLSVLIANHITEISRFELTDFEEWPGQGIEGKINSVIIRLGSGAFVNAQKTEYPSPSKVYVAIAGAVRGYFLLSTDLRPGIKELIGQLGLQLKALLSGDGDGELEKMQRLFPSHTQLLFNQSPHQKLEYISTLQHKGGSVMMLGDGINDSGALKQSNVGIAITDDTSVFTPACDGVLNGNKLDSIPRFLKLARAALVVLKVSLVISLLYNVVGLAFAITGHLTPLVAAILMPISSISVVAFTTLSVNWVSKQILQ